MHAKWEGGGPNEQQKSLCLIFLFCFCLAMKYNFYFIKSLEAWLDMEERMAMGGTLGGRSGLGIRPGAVLETPPPPQAGIKGT